MAEVEPRNAAAAREVRALMKGFGSADVDGVGRIFQETAVHNDSFV